MALTFLHTVIEQQSTSAIGTVSAADPASHVVCVEAGCIHERNEFYAEIIQSLNECMVESGCCAATSQSPVEDEPLARREWKRLLERVLSDSIKA